MTILFSELIKNKDYNTIRDILLSNFLIFKEEENDFFKRISIKNEETNKIEVGVSCSKGQDVFIYLKKYNSTIHISNSFGWSGQGQPHSTSNYVSVLNIDIAFKNEVQEIIQNCNKYNSLRDITSYLKTLFGLTIKKTTKYTDILDFKNKNPKLLTKYLKDFLFGKIIFSDLSSLNSYLEYNNISYDINTNFIFGENIILDNVSSKNDFFKPLFNKINSKLVYNETYFRLSDFQDIISELPGLNVVYKELEIENYKLPLYLAICNKDNSLEKINEIDLSLKNTYELSFLNDEVILIKEEKFSLIDIVKDYSNLKLSNEEKNKLVKLLNSF